jgi:hypothetical protein
MSQISMILKTPAHRRDFHHKASAATRSAISKRRSNRMALHALVGVSGEDRRKAAFDMQVKATNLNRHGAAVQLNHELQVGSLVNVRNQRGTQVTARVVAQLAALQGVTTYGIEFVDQDEKVTGFWGITFPTA